MARAQHLPVHRKSFATGVAIALCGAWIASPASASSPTPETEEKASKPAKELDALTSTRTEAPTAEDARRPAIHTRIPGVTDEELVRYKRQMYRLDI